MKIIAFKRANIPSLHPQFITEWIDASLLDSTEGYETMIEEHFELELAKNAERHEEHQKYLRDQELKAIEAEKAAQVVEIAKEKELNREFEIFKRWQLNKGKK